MTSSARAGRRASACATLLSLTALAAGCASTGSGAAGSPATASSPAQASSSASTPGGSSPTGGSTTPSSVTACSSSDLSAAVPAGQGGAAAGSAYYPLNFTNTSHAACSLYGYPGVSFVSGPSGSQIGAAATRNPAVTPATVTLAPGAAAHVTIRVVDALNYSKSACKPVTANWLKVFPPGQFTALYVKFSALTCSATLPAQIGSPLSVDAVKGGQGVPGQGL